MAKIIYRSAEIPPWPKLIVYGLQGVAMATYPIAWGLAFVGFGLDLAGAQLATFVTATVFTVGLTTLAHALAGHRLGVLSGPHIVPAFTMLTAYQAGLPLAEVFGGLLVGAVLSVVLGLLGVANLLQRFFTPLVMGSLIVMIGLGTASVGVPFLTELGVPFLLLAVGLGVGIGYISFTLSGFVSTIAVLIIVVIGYVISIATGHLNWQLVLDFPLISPPRLFLFGLAWPRPSILISAVVAMLVSGMQEIMHVSAIAQVADEPQAARRVKPALSVFGLVGGVIPSFLSATPLVTYAVNAGFIAATGVVSRYPMMVAGLLLMVISALGPLAGFLAAMPKPLAGAILLGVAGPVIGIGARFWRTGTPHFGDVEAFIVGFSIFLALGWQALPPEFVTQLPGWVSQVLGNPLIAVLVYVIVLEQVVFRKRNAFHSTPNTS